MNKPEREARRVLNELTVRTTPVDVSAIAEQLGAEIRYRRFDDDISGLLVRDADSKVIGVHVDHSKTRQRFTIAHEIGHLVMHKGDDRVIVEHLRITKVNWRDNVSAQATDREEIEANQFAAALLMPSDELQEYVRIVAPHGANEGHVQTLARKFNVSAQSMRFRLLNLALLDPVQ